MNDRCSQNLKCSRRLKKEGFQIELKNPHRFRWGFFRSKIDFFRRRSFQRTKQSSVAPVFFQLLASHLRITPQTSSLSCGFSGSWSSRFFAYRITSNPLCRFDDSAVFSLNLPLLREDLLQPCAPLQRFLPRSCYQVSVVSHTEVCLPHGSLPIAKELPTTPIHRKDYSSFWTVPSDKSKLLEPVTCLRRPFLRALDGFPFAERFR